jgi:hypothetical protein
MKTLIFTIFSVLSFILSVNFASAQDFTNVADRFGIANPSLSVTNSPMVTICKDAFDVNENASDSVIKMYDATNQTITVIFNKPYNNRYSSSKLTVKIYTLNSTSTWVAASSASTVTNLITIKSFKILSAITNTSISKTLNFNSSGCYKYTDFDSTNLIYGFQIGFTEVSTGSANNMKISLMVSTTIDSTISYNSGYNLGISECTSTETKEISIDNSSENSGTVYPNPVVAGNDISVAYKDLKEVYMYDLNGRLIKTSTENTIQTDGLKTGTYILKIVCGDKVENKNVFIIRK